MGLWVIFAILTGVAVLSVLWPLSRAPALVDRQGLDVAFYKAQADEIDRDAARGAIAPREADAARTEAARRLMAAAQRNTMHRAATAGGAVWPVRIASVGAVLFVPTFALALYSFIGRPDLPDMPLAARMAAPPSAMDGPTAIAKIEQHLAEVPSDGRGYEVLAPVYLTLGRADDAVRAYTSAVALLGPTAERYAGLGEAEVMRGSGVVTAEAKASFDKALALDPASPRAGFYLGLAALQDGAKAKALEIWRGLVAQAPPDAPWLPTVRARIAELSSEAPPALAKSAEDASGRGSAAAAIAAMPTGERQAAIERMVDALAERLRADGTDLEGWLRLVRAYHVLDEKGRARGALADARRSFAADAAATQRLDALAHELGIAG